jgi:hypothetical protein
MPFELSDEARSAIEDFASKHTEMVTSSWILEHVLRIEPKLMHSGMKRQICVVMSKCGWMQQTDKVQGVSVRRWRKIPRSVLRILKRIQG